MKKIGGLILFIFFTIILWGETEQIGFQPGQIYVGTQVNFTLQGTDPNQSLNPEWEWGDNTPRQNGMSARHMYKEPGDYTVKCSWMEEGQGKEINRGITVNDNRRVNVEGSQWMTGMEVQFSAINFADSRLKWDFGDSVVKNNGSASEKHVFQNGGNYTVKVFDFNGDPQTAISTNVNIQTDDRSVELQTSSPQARQVVSFQANRFSSSNLRWNFGDGSQTNGPDNMTHVYQRADRYQIKVADLSQPDLPEISLSVNISPDSRRINVVPSQPSLYQEINFQAVNFPRSILEWDFGDNAKQTGGGQMSHRYTRLGRFNVIVKEQGSENLPVETTLDINQDRRLLQIQPGMATVGQRVIIRLMNSDATMVDWRMGQDEKNNASLSLDYIFKDPGNFDIVCMIRDQSPVKGTVRISENRSINITPAVLFVGGKVYFATRNFNSPQLKWDFGDGLVQQGGGNIEHIYKNPGRIAVKVYDFAGEAKIPVEVQFNVIPDDRSILCKNQVIFKNSDVEFEAKNFRHSSIMWNMGDGASKMGGRTMSHVYQNVGNFILSGIDFAGKDSKKIELNIQVQNEFRQMKIPSELIQDENYVLALENAPEGIYEWQFGDGKRDRGKELSGKSFSRPGKINIKIIDQSGKYPPMNGMINVVPDNRKLTAASAFALPKEDFIFKAENFRGPSVKWNFGDGSIIDSNLLPIKHSFQQVGTYRVQAVDFSGKSTKPFSMEVKVAELTPDFEITHIEMTFADGKYYKVVPLKSMPPAYVVKFKVQGRGILKGEWLLDARSVGLFEVILRDAEETVMSKSKMFQLPVQDLGLHGFTLALKNYSFDKKLPVIRYFVSQLGAINIIQPVSGIGVKKGDSLTLKWAVAKTKAVFELAISEIPFQFLDDNQIKWNPVGSVKEFTPDLSPYSPNTWIYWQVREVNESGRVLTTSEISSFKIE